MLRIPATIRSRNKPSNPENRYNILQSQSENNYSTIFPYGSKPVSEKTMLTLKDYETITTSKRNFYLVVNEIPKDQIGQTPKASSSERTIPSTLSVEKPQINEILDTVRSGESLIKHFNFDTSKYNGDTNKCVAFWRTLMKTNIQPVKCTLIKAGTNWNRIVEGEETEEKEDNNEEEEEIQTESDMQMWYRALVELQRRKMDEVAFAATSQQCKLCDQEEPYMEFKKRQSQRFSKGELKDTEDIICLNNWNPIKSKKLPVDTVTDSKPKENIQVLHSTAPQQKTSSLKEEPVVMETLQSFSNLYSSSPEESMKFDSPVTYVVQKTNDQHVTPKECECRREICQCNKVWTRNDVMKSSSHSAHSLEEADGQNATRECECRREICQCNKVWTRNDVMKPSSHSTDSLEEMDEQNATPKECECRREICHCNKVWTRNDVMESGSRSTHSSEENDGQNATSKECECRREICQCNKVWTRNDVMKSCSHTTEEADEQDATSKECECRREICRCNRIWTRNDGIASTPMDSERINATYPTLEDTVKPHIEPMQGTEREKAVSNQPMEKYDQTREKELEKAVLPECDICKSRCNCWEHKIKMSKQFIDDLRYETRYKVTKQDKSCEQVIIEEVKEPKRFCVICGHNDCHCNGPEQQTRHKYFQYIQFDDDVITLLLEQKEKLSKRIGSRPLLEEDSKSIPKQIYDENVCCKLASENIETVYKPARPSKINGKKKLLITPEQRVKQIVNKKTHVLEIDKYGIPQVVRYADGKPGPKRATSNDIISSSMEDVKAAK